MTLCRGGWGISPRGAGYTFGQVNTGSVALQCSAFVSVGSLTCREKLDFNIIVAALVLYMM
jgi:hypothetical protein